MKRIALIAAASVFAACSGHKGGNASDTAGGVTRGGEVAPAAAPAPADTSMNRDTTGGGTATGAAENQTQVGVTNSKSGKSTLDTNLKKLEPTQGQAVTSKGDTLVKRKPPR
jgi:hypothetical protein